MTSEISPSPGAGGPSSPAGLGEPATNATPGTIGTPSADGLWWIRLSLGVVAVVVGVVVIAWPDATITVVAVLFGLNLLIDGVMRVVQAVLTPVESVTMRVLYGLLGIVSIVIGVLCLRNLLQTVAVLVLLVGLSWLIAGIVELIVVLSAGPPSRWTIGTAARLASGIVAAAAGVLVLAYPKLTLGTFVLLLGGSLVAYGAVSVASALQARRTTAA